MHLNQIRVQSGTILMFLAIGIFTAAVAHASAAAQQIYATPDGYPALITAGVNGKLIVCQPKSFQLLAITPEGVGEVLASGYCDYYVSPPAATFGNRAVIFLDKTYSTDGTLAGTYELNHMGVGAHSGGVYYGPGGGTGANGWQLWRSDATVAGTYEAANMDPGLHSECATYCGDFPIHYCCGYHNSPNSGCIGPVAALSNRLLFFGMQYSTPDRKLVFYEPGTGTTGTLGYIRPMYEAKWAVFNDKAYTLISTTPGYALVGTDGLSLWTVKSFPGATLNTHVGRTLITGADGLYFQANDGLSGDELWYSDGNSSGTRLVADLVPGSGGSTPDYLFHAGNLVLFSATTPTTGREIYKTDGSDSGTTVIKDIIEGTESSSSIDYDPYYCNVGTKTFFSAADSAHGRELWSTDGTEEGTQLYQDITPGAGSSNPGRLFFYENKAYFPIGNHYWSELWSFSVSDPTTVTDWHLYY